MLENDAFGHASWHQVLTDKLNKMGFNPGSIRQLPADEFQHIEKQVLEINAKIHVHTHR